MRRAKIVCTIGPKTSSPQQLRALVDAGMDVARLNLSHGEQSLHAQVYRDVRAASDASGRAVGILVDLQGPKIRTGRFKEGPVELSPGQRFTITTRDIEGSETEVSTTFKGLPQDVRPGDVLLIDDGKVCLRAVDVTDTDVVTETVIGGVVSNNKGINLPGVAVSVPALSEKDRDDLRFAMRLGVDMIALSFVRSADDIADVHAIMDEFERRIPVIAKIEKPQAVDNLEEIVAAFDGIMVARGDLGVEMPLEDVPIVQKRACELARQEAKPVIVATQVLESMIENPRPTRAEASDAANAVLDGADALMLSGETSVGAWPIEAVMTMARIIESTEEHGHDKISPMRTPMTTVAGAVTKAAIDIGDVVDAKFLITFTETGGSARRQARLRPRRPMLAFTSEPQTRSQLALVWGIETYLVPRMMHTDQFAMQVDLNLIPEGRVAEGDRVLIVAGSPPGIPGSTNALRVHRVGDAVNRAAPAYNPDEVTG
ncbi:pyruvate kinase [Intrasporangium calvum]|uniref:Pyruvate kinase n=1 Tax=Intrasporangium calvum TaxID=53358 RepID=A0ABT5GCT8_9MICO|nr:pyruvate kinase [Intrasporangium calvum]MDC5695882.1 pyruvate kinase [Intrasporangium calvum]